MNIEIKDLLSECKKAGYSIVSIGMSCDDLPLSKSLRPCIVGGSIFAGPGNPRERFYGFLGPAIWAIRKRLGIQGVGSCGGHSVHVSLFSLSKENKAIYRLVDGDWKLDKAEWA